MGAENSNNTSQNDDYVILNQLRNSKVFNFYLKHGKIVHFLHKWIPFNSNLETKNVITQSKNVT